MKCEIHDLEYEATIYPQIGIITKCPECLKEMREKKAQEQKEQEQRLKDEKIKFHWDYLQKFSNIPKRYLNQKINFDLSKAGEFKEHILSDDNLIIIGDTGAGKTCYISEILKANIDKCSIYLNASEILLLKNNFKMQDFLNALDGKGIVIIDEFQSLINAKEYFLIDLVIDKLEGQIRKTKTKLKKHIKKNDKAYLNGARIIIAGNITKEALMIFREPELKRAGSRLKDCEQLRILDFGLDDLRC